MTKKAIISADMIIRTAMPMPKPASAPVVRVRFARLKGSGEAVAVVAMKERRRRRDGVLGLRVLAMVIALRWFMRMVWCILL